MKPFLEILSWLYISWICELLFRRVLEGFRNSTTKKIENDDDIQVTISDEAKSAYKKDGEAASGGKSQIKESKKKLWGCYSKRYSTPIFDEGKVKEEVESVVSSVNEEWRNDPNVKNGLSRIDRVFKDKKITSYYNEDGKLVYQKENDAEVPKKSKELSFFEVDGEKYANPAFHIKPQPFNEDHKGVIDQTFDRLNKNHVTDIPEVKHAVDKNIDKTFNEIFGVFSA